MRSLFFTGQKLSEGRMPELLLCLNGLMIIFFAYGFLRYSLCAVLSSDYTIKLRFLADSFEGLLLKPEGLFAVSPRP